MAIFIPHGVLLHRILPRLPIKSVGRFMCVSKELHSFLSSNTFKKLYNHHQNHDKVLVLINDYKEPRTFGTINCEAPDNALTISSFKLPVAAYKEIKFLASLHGLVCVRVTIKQFDYDLILWNPLTSDWKKLSENKSYLPGSAALGFFYSSCEEDYKLLIADHYNIKMYSLKSDSWRSVAFKGTPNLDISGLSQCTCLNENLFFLQDHRKYSVVKFDTKTETFTEMKTSDSNYVKHGYRSTLMVKKGCIHVCVVYDVGRNGFETEVWKINEEGDWMKMGTYRVDHGNLRCRYMKPLHLTRNGNLLMLGYKYQNGTYSCFSSYKCKGFLYNVDLKKKHSKGKAKDKKMLCHAKEISHVVRYIETTVSPNQYIK